MPTVVIEGLEEGNTMKLQVSNLLRCMISRRQKQAFGLQRYF